MKFVSPDDKFQGMNYLPREAQGRLRELLRTFPVVLLHGPRQCGKSTFVRHVLPDWTQFDLERGPDRRLVGADPDGFLAANAARVVFDEVQLLPELLQSLRPVIDADRRPGRYVLLGSASPAILRSASESLAGRIGFLELAPFSAFELRGRKRGADRWFHGGYPPVHALRTDVQRADWLDAYLETFVQRDVPSFGYSVPPERLRKLLAMLAHNHGGLLNTSELARALGLAANTVAAHLDLLEGAFVIRRLQPHFANVKKRLVKSPKLYLRDSGLLHRLLELRSRADLDVWPRRGASFEGLVVEELCSRAVRHDPRAPVAFWRTHAGAEVDLLLKGERGLVPIEIRLGQQVDSRDIRGLRGCMEDLRLERGFVIYGGNDRFSLGGGVEVVPWVEVAADRIDLGLDRPGSARKSK